MTLLAKDLCPKCFVLARSISDHGERRLKAAGADRVVSPNIIGGFRMAHSVLHPKVVEFIDIVSGHAEIEGARATRSYRLPKRRSISGLTIGESEYPPTLRSHRSSAD